MKSKWRFNIDKLSAYVIGEDKRIYRLPFITNNRSYSFREIKKQSGNRYWLNAEYWSINQLKAHIIEDSNPIEIYPNLTETPF